MRELIVIALSALGFVFTFSGAVGILRMPDVYCRIQCSSKTITMGALPVLAGLVIAEHGFIFGGRVVIVAFLLLVVNPAASHALARAAYKVGVPMWPGSVRDEPRQGGGSAHEIEPEDS